MSAARTNDEAIIVTQLAQRVRKLLLDLERHRLINLLTDRKSSTLADWLREHPGVEIISRKRALFYAEVGCEGAPNPVQVAYHWYLSKKFG